MRELGVKIENVVRLFSESLCDLATDRTRRRTEKKNRAKTLRPHCGFEE